MKFGAWNPLTSIGVHKKTIVLNGKAYTWLLFKVTEIQSFDADFKKSTDFTSKIKLKNNTWNITLLFIFIIWFGSCYNNLFLNKINKIKLTWEALSNL